jgi:hypothetical protein
VVLATLPLGTSSDGVLRRTGHRTWQNVPGGRRLSALFTSSSTAIVRVLTSTACAIRETLPENVCAGYAATKKHHGSAIRNARRMPREPDDQRAVAVDDADDRRSGA